MSTIKVLAGLTASAGAVVSGSDGLVVSQGGVTVSSGDIVATSSNLTASTLSASALTVSSSANVITLRQGSASITLQDNEITLANSTISKTLTDLNSVTSGVTSTNYYGLRASVTGNYGTSSVAVSFSGSSTAFTSSNGNWFYKEITGLSSSTSAGLLDLLGYASFDVAVQSSGSSQWTNDLVSLTAAASNDSTAVGGTITTSYWFPKFTITGGAITSGSVIRLIVVNEKANVI